MKRGSAAALCLLAALPALAEDAGEAEYQRRRRAAAGAVGKSHRLAARWCADNGLPIPAWQEWTESLDVEPDHEEARRALGFVRRGDTWVRDGGANPPLVNDGKPREIAERLEVYRKKRTATEVTAARELAALARWAEERGYSRRATDLWILVRRYDGQNEAALKGSGWEQAGDGWYPAAEAAARRTLLRALEDADGGKAAERQGDLTRDSGLKLERRVSGHFDIEGKLPQAELARITRASETARAAFQEAFSIEEKRRVGRMTAVFLGSHADHLRFLTRCTPLDERERASYAALGGWSTFQPSITFEVWAADPAPGYYAEASAHLIAHLLLVGCFKLKDPPAWLQEGYAFWLSDRLFSAARVRCTDQTRNTGPDARADSTLLWRRDLRRGLREGTDPDMRTVLRARFDDLKLDSMVKAWSLVDWILETKPEALRGYADRLADGDPAVEALFELLGVEDYDGLQSRWAAWLAEKL
ncbi:MAG: hypothetical protein HUU15_01905 [Candidatus Brocadiae bacterium]|nr:hypothetical protein [Candidatus Brocadiia bacterium]